MSEMFPFKRTEMESLRLSCFNGDPVLFPHTEKRRNENEVSRANRNKSKT